MSEPGLRPPVGVLVVHGIGAQKPGQTLAKLKGGLQRVLPELPDNLNEGEAVILGGRSVKFYEVYWADLLTGEPVSGTFDMDEVSSLAWFPLFNQIDRAYAQEPYPLWTIVRWTFILPFVGFALFVAYWGAYLLSRIWEGLRESDAMRPPLKQRLAQRFKKFGGKSSHTPSAVDKLLDEYVGDILNYINAAGGSFPAKRDVPDRLRRVHCEVVDRFYDQLVRARNDGCQRIQIVAHSLGTVVMYHALRGLTLDQSTRTDKQSVSQAVKDVEHLYTIGCPLEKVRFIWPRLRCEQDLCGQRDVAWDNFVSYFDPVAGTLRRYREWGPVKNHYLVGGGFVSGHIVYERSDVFLETLTDGLLGQARALQRTSAQKRKDFVLLLGETLAAPAGLLALLAIGGALWVATALLVPFLASVPFRLIYPPEVWGPYLDYASLSIGALILSVFMVTPAIRARESLTRLRSGNSDVGRPAATQ